MVSLMTYSDTITHEGYLHKESQHLRQLRKRWMVLKGKYLFSYKEKQIYSSPTEIFDLTIYNKTKKLSDTQFEIEHLTETKIEKKRKFVTENIIETEKWINYISTIQASNDPINYLNLAPNTPIFIVFQKIEECLGINDNNKISSMQYINKLNKKWYYRAVDLLNVNKEIWNELKMPIILQNQIFKFIENCKQNGVYIHFKEPIPKQKNINLILNELETENKSNSTSNDIKILKDTLSKLYLFNINILKMYLDELTWNDIKIPQYLKIILLQKMHHQFEGQKNILVEDEKNEGQNDEIFPNIKELQHDLQKITDRGQNEDEKTDEMDVSMDKSKICMMLASELFVEIAQITKDLQPLFDYGYRRLYHLSNISDDLYYKLLSKAPKYLTKHVYDVITKVRGYNIKTLPFYDYDIDSNKKEIDIDWTMGTDKLFEILEQDLHFTKGELIEDCNLLMSNFYSNLWDWFFIPQQFWKTLPGYNSFEIIRIRINELMSKLVQKYNIIDNKTMPTLPQQWLNQYDPHLSIHQLLYGGNIAEFSLDGLDWNKDTINKRELIQQYMHKNYVGKLQLISEEHSSNNDIWTKYMNDNKIPSHIRFKIVFLSIRGNMQTDDDWLNLYIKNKYPTLPPQYVQNVLPPIPTFSVEDIGYDLASIKLPMEMKTECFIEIMDEEQKEGKWNHLVTLSNEISYLCENLKPCNSYQLRAKSKSHSLVSLYSIKSFRTLRSLILSDFEFLECQKMVNEHTKNEYETVWNMLYQGSRDGLTFNSFYNKCDGKRNTIFIVQLKNVNVICGGFTSKPWNKTKSVKANKWMYENDKKAFIYLLRSDKGLKPAIFPINSEGKDAISINRTTYIGFGGLKKRNRVLLNFNTKHVRVFMSSKGNKGTYEVSNGYEMGGDDKWYDLKELEVFELIKKTM